MHTRAFFAMAAGAASLLLGLALIYLTIGFQELPMLLGTNLIVDEQNVDYVPPWPMYVIPGLLIVAGAALVLAPLMKADVERAAAR